jgi:catechol 2,3-dioxygenase-like lactoylglutathione lyase family enzyme
MATQEMRVVEDRSLLEDARMASLIVYVHDLARSRAFYGGLLGLREVVAEPGSIRFDAGATVLDLRPAADYGITLTPHRDDSSDTVFLVDDVEAVTAALQRRGVEFARRRTYEIGAVVDFYDPNGHRLMLYQPSEKAMRSSSAPKMRAVWGAVGRGSAELIGPPAETVPVDVQDLEARGLDGKPLIYFFVFVEDMAAANGFFEDGLGLRELERTHCCNHSCASEIKGVVKYDCGGVMLSTHHMHGHHAVVDDAGNPYGAKEFEPEHAKGVAPVFHVDDLGDAVWRLARRGLSLAHTVTYSQAGATARVEAPSGHLFWLFEPSDEARDGPGGRKLADILAAEL